jgi:hypothetical protein
MVTNAYGTVHTWTPDAGITAGNTVIIGFAIANSTLPIVSVQTNTSVALTAVSSYDNGSTTSYIYRLTNAGSGVTSIVLTITASNAGTAQGVEISGADNSSPVDDTSTGTTAFEAGPLDDVVLDPATSNAAGFWFFRTDTRTLVGPPSGFSASPSSGSNDTFMVYKADLGAAGTKTAGIEFTAATSCSVVAAAIKKA